MAFGGNIAPVQVSGGLNNITYGVGAAVRFVQSELRRLTSELADPNKKTIVVAGVEIAKDNLVALNLAVSNYQEDSSNMVAQVVGLKSAQLKQDQQIGGIVA